MNPTPPLGEDELAGTVTRLQVIMGVLWVAVFGVLVVRQEWRAASILTLTVVAAIVQLRWLAAQVSGIVSLTLASAEATSSESSENASRGLPRTEGPADSLAGSDSLVGSEESAAETQFAEDEAEPDQDRAASVPKLFTIVTLRPAVLLVGFCILFYIGRGELLALAAGVLVLPASLMIEALLAVVRAPRPEGEL